MKKNKGLLSTVLITCLLFILFARYEVTASIMPRYGALFFTIFALFYALVNRKKMKITNFIVGLTFAYVTWFGISTLYANSGKFAVIEFTKILIAFAIFIFVVYSDKNKNTLNRFMWAGTSLGALITFLSIEGASLSIIEPVFEKVFYGELVPLYATFNGERISSFFEATNPLATLCGVLLFLSLYLYFNAETKLQKYIQALYLMIFANGIFLVFSMGGTFSLALACVAFLVLCKKEERVKSFFVVLQTAIIALISVQLTLSTYVRNSQNTPGSILPIVAIILGAVILIVIDKYINPKFVSVVEANMNKIVMFTVGTVIVAVVGVIFVLTQTTSGVISPDEVYVRTVYLQPGTYEIDTQILDNDSAQIYVSTRTAEEILINQTSVMVPITYISNDETITIEIDDTIEEVNVRIINKAGQEIVVEKISFVGEKTVDATLSYKFIPDNITSRLQGLKTNQSFSQRMEYVKDSLKLFKQSPIIGHGLGGFENAVQSVQDYQYETKYAHNHFMQTLVDGGLIGFISYTSLVLACAYVLIKSRKTNDLSAVLFGALIVMVVHGANEFSMSIAYFLPFAFLIFGLISATCDIEFEKLNDYKGKIFTGFIVLMSLFTILLAGNCVAKTNILGTVTLETLTNNTKIDVYDKNDYMISYVVATAGSTEPEVMKTTEKYLKKLEKAKSNTISKYLVSYYIQLNDIDKAWEQAENFLDYSVYDADTWNELIEMYASPIMQFMNLGAYYETKELHASNIEKLLEKLEQTNNSAVSDIQLSELSSYYIRTILASRDIDDIGEFLSYVTQVLYDFDYDDDLNNDGYFDGMNKQSQYVNIYQDNLVSDGDQVRIRLQYFEEKVYKVIYDGNNISDITVPVDSIDFEVINGKTVAYIDTNDIPDYQNGVEGYIDVVLTFKGDTKEFANIMICDENYN